MWKETAYWSVIVMTKDGKVRSARAPVDDTGRMYHIALTKEDLRGAKVAFLPGDPGRVKQIAKHMRDARYLTSNRGYESWFGYVGKVPAIAISTCIGGPTTGVVIEELLRLESGIDTMIRIGTTGAIQKEIKLSTAMIANAAVRLGGTSRDYVRIEYPAVATPEITIALKNAAETLNLPYVVGITASTDSFYVGQSRPGYRGYFPSFAKKILPDLQIAKVKAFEMEADTLFTLGGVYEFKTGCVSAVIANRVTNKFIAEVGVDDAIRIALRAVEDGYGKTF